MTERERLIELLNEWGNKENDGIRAESIADYLLENGVNLLPCNIGDTVYWVDGECISEGFITTVKMTSDEISYTALADYGEEIEFDDFEIGKTIFLTKAEAKKALKESSQL